MSKVEATEQLSDDDLISILERTTQQIVAPTALLMMISYAVIGVSHLLILRPPASYVMALLAFGTAISSGCIWRWHRSKKQKLLRSHDLVGIIALSVLANIATHMAVVNDLLQTTYFSICILACGFLMLDRTWFLASISAFVGVWALVFRSLPATENSYHFEYLIGLSSMSAIAVHIARHRATTRAETARILAERRREQMEAKLLQQQDQLAHASRLITMGELVASIAHELNQPLSAISNYATACKLQLSRPDFDKAALQSQLEQIGSTVVRTGEIIKRLRGLTSNTSTVRPGVDLNQVIRDAAAMMSMNMRHQDVELRMDLDEELPKVRADEIQMQQVVINLVQNGVDSSRESSRPAQVTLKSSMSSEGPQVSVMDNGPGIRVVEPSSVFDAFCTTKSGGMGMGLAICRSIVENHGGKIWCRSDGGGKKQQTEFYFSIPILDGVES